jgi:hypothetical protein
MSIFTFSAPNPWRMVDLASLPVALLRLKCVTDENDVTEWQFISIVIHGRQVSVDETVDPEINEYRGMDSENSYLVEKMRLQRTCGKIIG